MNGGIGERDHSKNRPRWFSGRAFAWATEGCGFNPQPGHIKSHKNMVQAAPLLTLGIER